MLNPCLISPTAAPKHCLKPPRAIDSGVQAGAEAQAEKRFLGSTRAAVLIG